MYHNATQTGDLLPLLVVLILYMLPTTIAVARSHHQVGPIACVNLLLGWTGLGWILSLAWSVSATKLQSSS